MWGQSSSWPTRAWPKSVIWLSMNRSNSSSTSSTLSSPSWERRGCGQGEESVMATIRLTPSLSASFRRLAVSSSASSTSPEPIHAFISSVSSLGWEADRIPLHCSLHSRDPTHLPSLFLSRTSSNCAFSLSAHSGSSPPSTADWGMYMARGRDEGRRREAGRKG